jgi:ribonuclease D
VKREDPRQPDQPAAQYLDSAEAVSQWIQGIRRTPLLAIDTEGASFHRFVDRIYLLQLSTREQTAIVDPLPLETPISIGEILEDPEVEIVFHDADYDLRLLRQDYGWGVRRIFDTRIAAQLLGIRAFGLAALLESHIGIKLDKKHQRADWSMRPLTRDMLAYAAQDTMHLPDLRDQLKARLEKLGRWSWAAEEFERLEGTRWEDEAPGMAFMRIKGARDLSRRELALLRELAAWRDEVARAQDRATFRVIGNEPLLEIARTQPRSREALASIPGMPRGILESRSGDMLRAVERGLEVPDAELPRFPRTARWERDPDFDSRVTTLRGVRDAVAAELDLDPGVLCGRDRLETIARLRPRTQEELATIPGMRRWQAEVLGERLLRALPTD